MGKCSWFIQTRPERNGRYPQEGEAQDVPARAEQKAL